MGWELIQGRQVCQAFGGVWGQLLLCLGIQRDISLKRNAGGQVVNFL